MHFRNFAPDKLLRCENNAFCTSPGFLVPLFGALRPPLPKPSLRPGQNPALWRKSAPYSTKIVLFFTPPRRPRNHYSTRAILYNSNFFARRAIFFSQFLCILYILCIFAESMSRSPRTKRTKATPRPLAPQNYKAGARTPPTRREQGEKLPSPPPRQCKRVHKPFLSIAPIGNDTRAPQSRPGVSPQFRTERELPCTSAGEKPFIVLSGAPRRDRPSPQPP